MEFFAWFENTTLSIWVREYPPAFPTLLVVHALGMGFAAGVNVLVCLRLLGFASQVSTASLQSLRLVMWLGVIASAVSGLLLLIAYPAKALTNPVFFFKLILIGAGIGLVQRAATLDVAHPRAWAIAGLACWFGSIAAGRFLAYTHSVLLASHFI